MTHSDTHVVTIFRNRLRTGAEEEYGALAPHISDLARAMDGYIDSKTFVAPDGERVTVVTFANQQTHDAWRDHPEHRDAQRRGVEEFYADYSIQVATVTYSNHFSTNH